MYMHMGRYWETRGIKFHCQEPHTIQPNSRPRSARYQALTLAGHRHDRHWPNIGKQSITSRRQPNIGNLTSDANYKAQYQKHLSDFCRHWADVNLLSGQSPGGR